MDRDGTRRKFGTMNLPGDDGTLLAVGLALVVNLQSRNLLL